MFSTTSPAVTAELRALVADPGAYPLLRLARALQGGGIPDVAARRAAAVLRDEALAGAR